MVLFDKRGVCSTEKGYPCEISNLNKVNVKLEKGTEIANISYSNEGLQNEVVPNDIQEIQKKLFKQREIIIQNSKRDTLNAFESNNITEKADFSNRTEDQVQGISMGKKGDKRILEENKPVFANNKCLKIGIKIILVCPRKRIKVKILELVPETK